MCRNRRLGGRRCPLHSSAGFIGARVARTESGLTAAQVNSTFRVLRREGHNAAAPTLTEWADYLNEKAGYLEDHSYHGHTMRSMRLHIEDAAENIPDGPTYYALKNLNERTITQSQALSNVINRLALRMEAPIEEVWDEFDSAMEEVDTSRGAPIPENYSLRALDLAQAAGAPSDVPTISSLSRLQEAVSTAEQNHVSRIQNPTLTPSSSSIYSIGYDGTDDGRLEVRMRNADGSPANTIFAYRDIDTAIANRLMSSENNDVDGSLCQLVTSQAGEFAYASIAEANGDAQVRRCAQCGQFASLQHICPSGGSTVVERSAMAFAPTADEIAQVRALQANAVSEEEKTAALRAALQIAELETSQLELDAMKAYDNYSDAANEVYMDYPDNLSVEERELLREERLNAQEDSLKEYYRTQEVFTKAKNKLSGYQEKMEEIETVALDGQADIHNVLVREALLVEKANRIPYTADDLEYDIENSPLELTMNDATEGLCNPDDGMGFGVELEFMVDNDAALDIIARQLRDVGLSRHADIGNYHDAQRNDWQSWSLERDETVSAELVSRVLHDTPEDWEELRQACEIITTNGGRVSNKTGGHIHISSNQLGNSVTKHAELINMANEYEDVIYRLGTEGGEEHRTTYWCAPNQDANDVYQGYGLGRNRVDLDRIKEPHSGHNVGMNISGSGYGEKSHVEFRQWDGSLNPAVIQARVIVGAAMVDKASRSNWAEPSTVDRIIPQRFRREIGYHAALPTNNDGFLDFQSDVLTSPTMRAKVTSLFAVTTWQSNLPENDPVDDDFDENDPENYMDDDDNSYY